MLSKPKTLLIIPVREFQELAKRSTRTDILVDHSEKITEAAYNHFFKDGIDLSELNEAIKEGNYTVSPEAYGGIMKRLNLMNLEVIDYKRFGSCISPLLEESKELKHLVGSTNLLTGAIENDIQKVRKVFNRRVY
jgi:hypothetical protein